MTDGLRATLQQTLGDGYTLGRELGGGGMSRVFVARENALRECPYRPHWPVAPAPR